MKPPYAVDSEKLGRTVWIAADIEQARQLFKDGVRDPIFLGEEIPLIKKAGDGILHPLAAIKDVFPGCRTLKVSPPGPTPQVRSTYTPPSRQSKKIAIHPAKKDN